MNYYLYIGIYNIIYFFTYIVSIEINIRKRSDLFCCYIISTEIVCFLSFISNAGIRNVERKGESESQKVEIMSLVF